MLNQILKQEWGFDGFVTSDFGAVHSTVPSALSGLDLELPDGKYFGTPLQAAVASNQVSVAVLDEKLVRRFRTMIRHGLFDSPPKARPIAIQEDGVEARALAEAGLVLLKNDGDILPLNAAKLRRVALIGPAAEKAITGGGGSSHVIPFYTVDPLAGLRERAGTNVQVDFSKGEDVAQAVALAKAADVAVVMLADKEAEGHDHSLKLGGKQNELVEAVAAANPHTIMVLKTGSAVLMPWAAKVPGILEAWYPGEEDGHAVAAVLFGDVNPAGKLPLTFPMQTADLPANTPEQYPGENGEVRYLEDVLVGYRYFNAHEIRPLFPFGCGLSYTTFGYERLAVSASKVSARDLSTTPVAVDFQVANTGRRAGQEIAELYVGLPSTAGMPQPPKQLKGFSKVSLAPGTAGRVHLELNTRALAGWNPQTKSWEVRPGTYRIMAGSSSEDIRLKGEFTLVP